MYVGVGQVVAHIAAASRCKQVWGIEKAQVPAGYANVSIFVFIFILILIVHSFCVYFLITTTDIQSRV